MVDRSLMDAARKARGIALVMVLWILVLLTMIVSEFMFSTRLEFNVAMNYKERMQAYYYALAGVNAAIAEMMAGESRLMYYNGDDLIFSKKRPDSGLEEPPRRSIDFGNGGFRYFIKDESGKLDLNALTEPNDRTMLRLFSDMLEDAGVDEESRRIIRDSIRDWRDKDDTERDEGAEDDWYESNYELMGFDRPYYAKNGNFDSVAELAMVRGMSNALLYGGAIPREARERMEGQFRFGVSEEDELVSYRPIAPYLTVFNQKGARGGVSLNFWTMEPKVMRLLAGDNDDLLNAWQEQKSLGPFEGRVPGSHAGVNFTNFSQYFRVVSTGYMNEGTPNQTIVAVLNTRKDQRRSRIKVLFWLDDAPLPERYGGKKVEAADLDEGGGIFGDLLAE